jgi:hypothetical protein
MTIKFYKSIPPYGYLNNFCKAKMKVFGKIWETVEHAYQSQKTLIPGEVLKIWAAKTPREARNIGQLVQMRPDWDDIKDDVMYDCVWAKFSQNSDLKQQLLDTGDQELEDSKIDPYWGCGADGKDHNILGNILMEVRKELRDEAASNNLF